MIIDLGDGESWNTHRDEITVSTEVLDDSELNEDVLSQSRAYAESLPAECEARVVKYRGPLDSHAVTRAWVGGYAVRYTAKNDAGRALAIWSDDFHEMSATARAKLLNAVFLIDDGRTVVPHYVTGWSPASQSGLIFLHPFPTNPDGRTRSDNGRVIDYDDWFVSARRCYHLRVSPVEPNGSTD
jgi:hypothetical protein